MLLQCRRLCVAAAWLLVLVLVFASPAHAKKSKKAKDAKRGIFSTTGKDVDALRESIDREYRTDSGKLAVVSDSYIPPEMLSTTTDVLRGYVWWAFEFASADGSDKVVGGDGIPWGARLSATEFIRFSIGQKLQRMAHYIAGDLKTDEDAKTDAGKDGERASSSSRSVLVDENVKPLLPYDVHWKVLRRGDLTTLHRASSEEAGEVWMAIFANERWQDNNYGDLFLYDDEDEIIGGANPQYARLVAWNASMGYLVRPPCIDFSRGQNVLVIRWTRDEEKVKRRQAALEKNDAEVQKGRVDGFVLSGDVADTAPTLDVKAHQVLHRQASNGKSVYAFDGLFNESDLADLRRYIVRHGLVFYDDTEDSGYSDNVQWISGFEVSYFVQSKYWRIVKQVCIANCFL